MNIADLFVTIGLKGNEKVTKGLTGIQRGMGGIVSSSIAAKAAILAALYGLEKFTGMASQAGMDLKKFGMLTGLSTTELQKWQHALMLYDVSGQETASTIEGIQAAMTEMQTTGEAPAGMELLGSLTGGIDPSKLNDTFYILGKITKLVQTPGVSTSVLNQIAKTFGMSSNVIQGLRTMNFERDKGTKKDWFTPKQRDQLAEINKSWKLFWFDLQMIGSKAVLGANMKGVMESVVKFAEALGSAADDLATLYKLVPLVADAFDGIGETIKLIFSPFMSVIEAIHGLRQRAEGKEDTSSNPSMNAMNSMVGWFDRIGDHIAEAIRPKIAGQTDANIPVPAYPVTINQYGVDHKDAKGVGTETQRGYERAHRKLSSGKGS